MSLTKNQKLSFWKEVESQIRSNSLRMDNHRLSIDDTIRVSNAYVLWALVIQDLLGDARICSDTNMRSWILYVSKQDIGVVQDQIKLMLACIRNWSPYQGTISKDSFKHYLFDNGLHPADRLFYPLWSTLYHFSTSFEGFDVINSILSFTCRLTLTDVDWIERQAVVKYTNFERDLHDQSYNSETLAALRSIYLSKIKYYHVDGHRPKHGNGATYETRRGAGIDEKFSSFKDTQATYQIARMVGWDHPLIEGVPIPCNDVHARIVFVPKGINKKRVISTEPICNQYYQHMIASSIDDLFIKDATWGVDLHNQTYNQDLALLGSGHGDYATIDLSDASDSVTHTLVTAIMHGTPLYSLLERCRTRSGILPDGSVIAFEKYAPMGSAICFPLECMIFSLIVQLASKRCGVNPYFRVYGDDIVVPSSIFSSVLDLLKELHFNTNYDKTFPPFSIFTESCGIECYNGLDVTPIRIPRFFDIVESQNLKTSPGRVFGIITFANSLYDRCCFSARSYVVSYILDILPDVPFTTNRRKGLFSPAATNFHLKKRWNAQLQRYEYQCSCLCTASDEPIDERRYSLLLERYDTSTRTALSDPSDLLQLMVGHSHLRLRRRWRSQWDLDSIGETYSQE